MPALTYLFDLIRFPSYNQNLKLKLQEGWTALNLTYLLSLHKLEVDEEQIRPTMQTIPPLGWHKGIETPSFDSVEA